MLPPVDAFVHRHIGPTASDRDTMLRALGLATIDDLVAATVPANIRAPQLPAVPPALTEREALAALAERAGQNELRRSFIGMGYYGTVVPPVILRNILENPGWYTAYTPYQAEISQGRLEALLVFQTMIQELTGLPISNASLLDEGTAAAEAMAMARRLSKVSGRRFLVDRGVHPQTLAVVTTRAAPLDIEVVVTDLREADLDGAFGVLAAICCTDGTLADWTTLCSRAQAAGVLSTLVADLLACCLIVPPGEMGADIAVGSAQRFGVPMGYGGPHAAFLATRTSWQRQMPGRLIGVAVDADGNPALRMALQTREQHIRREKATSNVCTAQVLLAIMAGAYGVWHGPDGLRVIARRVHGHASAFAAANRAAGRNVSTTFFDTVRVEVGTDEAAILARADAERILLRRLTPGVLTVAFDETIDPAGVAALERAFGISMAVPLAAADGEPTALRRESTYLAQPVFHNHRSETQMLRWLHGLEVKDYALNAGMIPLGSCTLTLNATTEMIPVTFPGFGNLHPFAPPETAKGYRRLFDELAAWLAAITGFDVVSLQPNAGSQGEYAGLLAIRAWHRANGGAHRDVCLIPTSAHGTNPATAVMCGMEVIVVACDDDGNVDLADLSAKATAHADRLAAMMITYPSTHGVFEEGIVEACRIIHQHGGQVYMDGANLNAQVGLVFPGKIGADVLHINLHKTFCIPHGGGGPGMGPICASSHLAPYLPGHPVVGPNNGASDANGPVSSAPWGSASILPISWANIAMLGPDGLRSATQHAILAANYLAKRLEGAFDVLYRGRQGFIAHECILDLRPFKAAGVTAEDVAKRLMDYGFHAPTLSFPVAGTLMVEPTESEPLAEIDRFIEAMLSIREEIRAVELGEISADASPLRHAPHTALRVTAAEWPYAYSRQTAAFPTASTRASKYWPTVGRVDNAAGDRNLICSCDAWPDRR